MRKPKSQQAQRYLVTAPGAGYSVYGKDYECPMYHEYSDSGHAQPMTLRQAKMLRDALAREPHLQDRKFIIVEIREVD